MYFLDLGDSTGAAVKICTSGWQVVDRPDVQFKRPEGHLSLPVPSRDGSIELLRKFVNVSDQDFRLVVAWLTAALRPVGPYPILSIHGEQGSAKSTLARVLRMLIDPRECPLLAEPASTRDLMITALNEWLLAFDNITAIPDWLSDSLCRLVFGGGFAGRAMFSDNERFVIHAQRPVILNGIEDFVRKSDLVDRTVFLHLPAIVQIQRLAEDDFWNAFSAATFANIWGRARRDGGGAAGAAVGQTFAIAADGRFCQMGRSGWPRAGLACGAFADAYGENRLEATETSLRDSPLGELLLQYSGTVFECECSPTELYQMLTKKVGPKVARSKAWPKTTRLFTNELRRLAPQLRARAVHAFQERAGSAG